MRLAKLLRGGAQLCICVMLGSTLMLTKVRIGTKLFAHGLADLVSLLT